VNISRKDFFRQTILSLGRTIVEVANAVRPNPDAVLQAQPDESSALREPDEKMVASAFNEHCLARQCGCFACVDRCEPQAILVVMGEGIRVEETKCTGCGTCEYVCPMTPKAVRLQPRQNERHIPADTSTLP